MSNNLMDSISAASAMSADSGNSLLKHSKSEKQMQWWYLGPVVLAVLMFLLMGTIFERRIEGAWRSLVDRRQGAVSQTEPQESPATVISNQTVKTTSDGNVFNVKPDIKTTLSKNDIKQETKSLY
ncbi:unnamed protein product [Arctia plantaginis]|uniref:Uncharacterized protein n=1 Tax=Arctia plantaginis TaxID=874455 RepID=A0A8S1ALR3_ARCPL|nr:unnamed protein product [Arctia plantaginis]CAB3248603.1 unnamed protein product [Arctia plantaginis]